MDKGKKSQPFEGKGKIQRGKEKPRTKSTESKADHPHAVEQPITESLFYFPPRFEEERIEGDPEDICRKTKEKKNAEKRKKTGYCPLSPEGYSGEDKCTEDQGARGEAVIKETYGEGEDDPGNA